jgi:hypothetical protein
MLVKPNDSTIIEDFGQNRPYEGPVKVVSDDVPGTFEWYIDRDEQSAQHRRNWLAYYKTCPLVEFNLGRDTVRGRCMVKVRIDADGVEAYDIMKLTDNGRYLGGYYRRELSKVKFL